MSIFKQSKTNLPNVDAFNKEWVHIPCGWWVTHKDRKFIADTIKKGWLTTGPQVEKFESLQERIPERIIEQAVKGMLPKNKLGNKLYGNLHVFVGSEHDKAAQKPKKVELN